MSQRKDYYKILGIPKEASLKEIKKAYRRLAKLYHPDLHPNDREKEELFLLIKEAYEVLSDPDKRQDYDLSQQPTSREAIDFFETTFVTADKKKRGEDIIKEIEVSPEQAGQEIKILVSRMVICPVCKGERTFQSQWKVCPTCHGLGRIKKRKSTIFSEEVTFQTCPKCGGKGEVPSEPCSLCQGRGLIEKREQISLLLPPVLDDSLQLVIKGMGNECTEGESGDLIVRLIKKS